MKPNLYLYEVVVGNSRNALGLQVIKYVEASSGETAGRWALLESRKEFPDDAANLRVISVSEMDGDYIGKVEPKK